MNKDINIFKAYTLHDRSRTLYFMNDIFGIRTTQTEDAILHFKSLL